MHAMMHYTRPSQAFDSEFLFFKIINLKTASYFCDFHRLVYTDGTIHYRVVSDAYAATTDKSISIDLASGNSGQLLVISFEGKPPGDLLREVQHTLTEHLQ